MATSKVIKDLIKSKQATVNKFNVIQRVDTGNPQLNNILSGGLPRGRISVLWGPSNSGKTTIATIVSSKFIERKERVAFVDFENTFDSEWAKRVGLDVDAVDNDGDPLFYLYQGANAETGLQFIIDMVKDDPYFFGMIVIDSVAASVPSSLDNSSMDKASQMAARAQLMTKFVSIVNLHNDEITILAINQERDNIGAGTYDPKVKQTGGRALIYGASVIMNTMNVKQMLDPQGNTTAIKFRVRLHKIKTGDYNTKTAEIVIRKMSDGTFSQDIPTDLFMTLKNNSMLYNKKMDKWSGKGVCFLEDGTELGKDAASCIQNIRESQALLERVAYEVSIIGAKNDDGGESGGVSDDDAGE